MDTERVRRSSVGRIGAALGAAGLLGLAGCGGDAGPPAVGVPVVADDLAGGFEEVIAAVGRANIAVCASAEGGDFIPLPAPAGPAAAAAAYFRYREGRIYAFAPCQVPAKERNELRIFRYDDSETRDAAIREMAGRPSRPTSAFAVADTYEAQIWSPDPSLEGPVGQAAAAAHFAISRVERTRHLDVGP